jgi:uncharacterized membrane protein HdeD (DUF308 family)
MWPLTSSRYLALAFAIVLAVVEALLNMSRPQWQYAPLWIIDYVIVAALLIGFWLTRRPAHTPVLMAGWALAAGVFYMALFVSLDPEVKWGNGPDPLLLFLIGLGLGVQVLGLILATIGHYRVARA